MDRPDRTARIEHYRKKAATVRAIAESQTDADSRHVLMTVATDYLMLALVMETSQMPDPIPASE